MIAFRPIEANEIVAAERSRILYAALSLDLLLGFPIDQLLIAKQLL